VKSQVALHIYGEGKERNEIIGAVQGHGLQGQVTLHGVVPKPQEALSQIGLLVLPSAAEGFGLVLIEAMAARVPVVATDVPGIRDVVRDGENGVLVRWDNEEALAKGIDRVVNDLELRRSMVERAYQDVAERFTWERVMKRYREVLGI
jgi:glycosyltransferase involved in cell wall biosynthesis